MRFLIEIRYFLILVIFGIPASGLAGIVLWITEPVNSRTFQRDIRYIADYFGENPILFQKQIVSLTNPYYYFQKTHTIHSYKQQGFQWRPPILPSQNRYRIDSLPKEVPEYSATKLSAWRESVEKDLEALRKLGLLSGATLLEDLKHLATESGGNLYSDDTAKEIRRLLRVLPLVYEIDGRSRLSKEKGKFILGSIIDEYKAYEEFFLHGHDELWSRSFQAAGFKNIGIERKKVVEQYLKKEIASVLTPIKLTPGNRIESISFQEMHPGLSPFRGGLGGDCAHFSIPFYASHPDTKVFELRKNASFDTVPDGYVFVTEVDHQGKRIPYVLTVNGPYLTAEESHNILLTVAKIYGSDKVLLPDGTTSAHLNNNPAIRETFSKLPGISTVLEAPKGWDAVSSLHTRSSNDFSAHYGNYYEWQRLKKANVIQVADINATPAVFTRLRSHRSTPPTEGIKVFLNRPAAERALMAALMLEPRQSKVILEDDRMQFSEKDRDTVKSVFQIKESDLTEAESFLNRKADQQILFLIEQRNPIYGLESVRKFMKEEDQVKIARAVYDHASDRMNESEWKSWFGKLDRFFEKEKSNAYLFRSPDQYLAQLKKQQNLVPSHFRVFRENCADLLKTRSFEN